MLPIHPQPIKDEILSSWMVRLAVANNLPIHTFYNNLLQYKGNIWNRDIDRTPSDDLLNCLCDATGQVRTRLLEMTLSHLQGYYLTQYNPYGVSKWILPIGVYHRERSRPGTQYCPECLRDSEKPYLKLCWRLSFIVACPKHKCLLHQTCPNCRHPIEVHRLAMGRSADLSATSFKNCYYCQQPLTNIDSDLITFKDSGLKELFFKSQDLETLYQVLPDGAVYPSQLLEAVRMLIVMLSKQKHTRLRSWLGDKLGISLNDFDHKASFDFESINTRFWVWSAICWLLMDWPKNIIRANQEIGINRSMLPHENGDIPYWLDKVALAYLEKKQYTYSREELQELSNFLDLYDIDIRPTSLMGGRDQSSLAADRLYQTWLSISNRIDQTYH